MRIPETEYTSRPWRIHEITPDFRVEDVWRYRTPGAGPDDFPTMLDTLRDRDPEEAGPLVKFLFDARWKLGEILGWDGPPSSSLRDRLPADLRALDLPPANPRIPLRPLYELPTEAALELSNKTCQGVCHLGWVESANGDYELHMTVLVKPNGLFGQAYMAAIAPFRHLIVYPAMTRQWERAWLEHPSAAR